MMRRASVLLLVATLLLLPPPSTALVDPAPSSLLRQPWLVQIYVDDDGKLTDFCKGALISAQWILTSGYCVYDPFEALGPRRDQTGAKYVVRFAGSDQVHKVTDFVPSSDLLAGMMKLETPVAIQPLSVSKKSAAELRNVNVFILGNETTAAVGNVYFNPDFGKRMDCSINGQTFYTTGAICYVLARAVKGSTQLETRAVVIDPAAAGSPNSALDVFKPFDMSGKRLYLDFRADRSYPCHEDLGAPILRMTESGTVEMVGIVSGTGMAIGMPLCNPTLGNVFGTVSSQQSFIDGMLAQGAFDAVCPPTPDPEVAYTGGRKVRLSWDPVAGATGYRLFYATKVGYEPYLALDVGNKTEIDTEIQYEPIYRVAMVAYNDVCTSPISDELTVAL
jgi:hypothetical protein